MALNIHANLQALLDSGATDNFISPLTVERFHLPTIDLPKSRVVCNVDGTQNKNGSITHATKLEVQYKNHTIPLLFLIMDMGSDSMLLGMPFLAGFSPDINWKEGIFHGDVTASTKDAHLWASKPEEYIPELKEDDLEFEDDYKFIPSNERNTITVRKTTTATELATQASDKRQRTWEEQVPSVYHQYGRVFSDQESTRFPGRRPWDHAIDLLPEAPTTLNCKVYPLAEGQQEALDKFLDEHLAKGYIRRSNSPYTSPFFFVKKKDGKLRPVQDYRALNNWTVRNTYPLPLIKELISKLVKKKWFTKLDIRWEYNNVCIKENNQWKTAFKMNRGLFECLVINKDLRNMSSRHTLASEQHGKCGN